jgi:hypothetical protein
MLEAASESAQELLDFIAPFHFGSSRTPTARELAHLDALVHTLEQSNPNPLLAQSFALLEGMWRCVFTSSPYVLGLDKIPMLDLSGVYQCVHLGPAPGSGHYFNIGELSRRGSVKLVCGEHAQIEASDTVRNRMELRYDYFYFAPRLIRSYEGHLHLAGGLEANRLARSFRLPFRKPGWQSILYLDSQLRVVRGNESGLFVLTKSAANLALAEAVGRRCATAPLVA